MPLLMTLPKASLISTSTVPSKTLAVPVIRTGLLILSSAEGKKTVMLGCSSGLSVAVGSRVGVEVGFGVGVRVAVGMGVDVDLGDNMGVGVLDSTAVAVGDAC